LRGSAVSRIEELVFIFDFFFGKASKDGVVNTLMSLKRLQGDQDFALTGSVAAHAVAVVVAARHG
jgi:hypothetical protein